MLSSAPTTPPHTRHRLPYVESVQLLRGIAALTVVLAHSVFRPDIGLPIPLIHFLGSGAQMGVACFFVISGFTLPYSLHCDYELKEFPKFMLKRLIRLEPTYVFALGLAICMKYIQSRLPDYPGVPWLPKAGQVAAHFFYLIPFTKYDWILDVAWTLAIEFQFYLLIALLFPFLRTLIGKSPWGTIALILITASSSLLHHEYESIANQAPLFAIGIISYMLRSRAVGYTAHILTTLCLSGIYAVHNDPALALGAACTAFVIAFWSISKTKFEILGNISYSLYLVHVMVLFPIIRVGMMLTTISVLRGLIWLFAVFASLVAAYFVYRFIEKPCQETASRIRYRAS